MEIRQLVVSGAALAEADLSLLVDLSPQLVLVFASLQSLRDGPAWDRLRAQLPQAQWMGSSTAGEISNEGVGNGQVVLSGIRWTHTRFRGVGVAYEGAEDSGGRSTSGPGAGG